MLTSSKSSLDKRVVASVYLSNGLEFFDYTLFGALTLQIGHAFFAPDHNALGMPLLAFCLSLVCRPLGSLLFGYIGDRYSRLLSLQLSVAFMTLSTLTVGFLPGFETLGSLAGVVIILTRVVQGLSAGGEYNTAAIFAIEKNPNSGWFVSGLVTSAAFFGMFLALLFSFLVQHNFLPPWFWRVGFILGSTIGLSAFLMRSHSSPTKSVQETAPAFHWDLASLKKCFLIFLVGAQSSCMAYFAFVVIGPKLKGVGTFSPFQSDLLAVFMMLCMAFFCLFTGRITKFFKSGEKVLKLGMLGLMASFPVFMFSISHLSFEMLLLEVIGLTFLMAFQSGTQHNYYQLLFSKSTRQRAISVSFSLGVGVVSTLTITLMKDLSFDTFSYHYFWFSTLSLLSFLVMRSIEREKLGILNKEPQRLSA